VNGNRLSEPKDGQEIYRVRSGDTLGQIAISFGTTVEAILEANPDIDDPNRIYVGERLRIPVDDADRAEVVIAPTNGEPGTDVRLTAEGLPAEETLAVGVGRVDSEFDVVDRANSDAQGQLSLDVPIPEYAETGERWVVVLEWTERDRKYLSNIFLVE
jgi:LysM repeat protein